MRKTQRAAVFAFAAILSALVLAGCGPSGTAPQTGGEEIRVEIKLDLKEDIGLLLTDWNVNGQDGMSGASNANKSMIKRNSTEYWTFEKQHLDNPADTVDLTLRFIVVTEYFEPNYDFAFPEEYMMPTEAISFTARFGGTYAVTITGDKASGYQAVLEGD